MIFIEDNDLYLKNLQAVIWLFEATSILNINRSKSTISSINVYADRTSMVANQWDISYYFLPINYLGIPLGSKPLSKAFWENINKKNHKKLGSTCTTQKVENSLL